MCRSLCLGVLWLIWICKTWRIRGAGTLMYFCTRAASSSINSTFAMPLCPICNKFLDKKIHIMVHSDSILGEPAASHVNAIFYQFNETMRQKCVIINIISKQVSLLTCSCNTHMLLMCRFQFHLLLVITEICFSLNSNFYNKKVERIFKRLNLKLWMKETFFFLTFWVLLL